MKLRGYFFLFGICFLILSTFAVKAQIGIVDRNTKTKPTLIVLGTYHIATPGNNVVNGKVDDVTTPERQRQIIELVERLKTYRPTKIVVEIDSEDDAKTKAVYNQYLSGTYQLSRNAPRTVIPASDSLRILMSGSSLKRDFFMRASYQIIVTRKLYFWNVHFQRKLTISLKIVTSDGEARCIARLYPRYALHSSRVRFESRILHSGRDRKLVVRASGAEILHTRFHKSNQALFVRRTKQNRHFIHKLTSPIRRQLE